MPAPGGLMPLQDMYPVESQSLVAVPQGVPDQSYGEYITPPNNGVAPYNQSTSNNTTPHSNQTTVPSLDSNAPTFSLDAPDNLNNNYAGISENQHYFDFSKSYGLEPVASGSGSYSNWNPNAPGPSTGNAYIGNGYVGNVAYGNL